VLALAVLPALVGAGCSGGGPSKSWAAERRKEAEPLAVAVEPPTVATLERFYESSGTLVARRQADVVAVQTGVIVGLEVEEGDRVVADQLLARLDGRRFALEAERAAVEARNASLELERLRSGAAAAVIPREEVERQRYALDTAIAAAKVSKQQVRESAVRAPFAGTVMRRHVDPGNLATTATPLFTIADISALELELHLPEREASGVPVAAPVAVELLDGTTFTGSVLRRAPMVDTVTGTVRVTILVESPPPSALPGSFARAKVLVERSENTLAIPRSALVRVEGQPHVFVLVDGKAKRVPIQLGIEAAERYGVLGGLAPDDRVVVDAGAGIHDGLPLRAAGEPAAAGRDADGATTESAPATADGGRRPGGQGGRARRG
jgi:membrane fusion protein (multidrug efflux system)